MPYALQDTCRVLNYDRDKTRVIMFTLGPRPKGSKLLLVTDAATPGTFTAQRWLRKMPRTTGPGETIIRFAFTF